MKFSGLVGFWEDEVEVDTDIWRPQIVERPYFGDVLRNSRSFQAVSNQQNDDFRINNRISILADLYFRNSWIININIVNFSPPSSKKMNYPCIKYELDRTDAKFADNLPYATAKKYTVTVIDPNPDSELPEEMLKISFCRFDRTYIADGLNHFVFTLYY